MIVEWIEGQDKPVEVVAHGGDLEAAFSRIKLQFLQIADGIECRVAKQPVESPERLIAIHLEPE